MKKRPYICGEKKLPERTQSFKVILKGGGSDAGNKCAGCSLFAPQDLLSTLVTPLCAPGAHLGEELRSSTMLSPSCCVQPIEALAGAWGTWRAGESEVRAPISFPTRMQVDCFILRRVPAPIRQASFNIYGFSNFLRASATAFFPYPFRTRRGSNSLLLYPRVLHHPVMVNLPSLCLDLVSSPFSQVSSIIQGEWAICF